MIDITKMAKDLEGIKIYYLPQTSGGLADQGPIYSVRVLPERPVVGANEAEQILLSTELLDWFNTYFD